MRNNSSSIVSSNNTININSSSIVSSNILINISSRSSHPQDKRLSHHEGSACSICRRRLSWSTRHNTKRRRHPINAP